MKTTLQNKTTVFILTIAVCISLGIYSCKKEGTSTTTPMAITEADAVELTTDAVVPANAGLVLQVGSSVNVYKTISLACGVQKDSTITRSSATGATPSYSYTLNYNYLLTCAGLIPSKVAFNFTGTTTYDGPKMTASDSSTGSFILIGLPAGTSAYTLGLNYTRNGSHTSKIGAGKTFTSKLVITSTNIMIDKTSLQVLSGTAAIALTGSSTSGKTFSYAGTITFLSSNKATLVLNSGTSYAIQW